jgi:hypothetical protein
VVSALLLTAVAAAGPTGHYGFGSAGEGGYFLRGDSNQDGKVDLSDAVFTLGVLFLGGDPAFCLDALDADDDGEVVITDAIYTLGVLFLGGNSMPPPFPLPARDPTEDALGCDNGDFAHFRREMFMPSCSAGSCHSKSDAAGALDLESGSAYSQLIAMPAANAAASAVGLLRVKPGAPEDSYLYQLMSGQLPPGGHPHVPDFGTLLDPTAIAHVERWIRDGALPSSEVDITLPVPAKGHQIVIPAYPVQEEGESQRNYFFKLDNAETIWVDRLEFLSTPGIDHWNFFTWQSGPPPPSRENGDYDDRFALVSFRDWNLRASHQTERLDWKLPAGVAMQFAPFQQTLSQIHFVNVGSVKSPIGGAAAINLHTVDFDVGSPPAPLGALIAQNRNIRIPPMSTVDLDYGITFTSMNHDVPVKLAAVQGHFHWRGKTFEMRVWDGLNQNADGSPATGEFDRMGPGNTIYFSDNFEPPPYLSFGDDGPQIPAGSGIVFRSTFVNQSEELYCVGSRAELQEHSIAFIYFYPGPLSRSGFLWFPPECLGQGCAVSCL